MPEIQKGHNQNKMKDNVHDKLWYKWCWSFRPYYQSVRLLVTMDICKLNVRQHVLLQNSIHFKWTKRCATLTIFTTIWSAHTNRSQFFHANRLFHHVCSFKQSCQNKMSYPQSILFVTMKICETFVGLLKYTDSKFMFQFYKMAYEYIKIQSVL